MRYSTHVNNKGVRMPRAIVEAPNVRIEEVALRPVVSMTQAKKLPSYNTLFARLSFERNHMRHVIFPRCISRFHNLEGMR